MLDLVVHLLIPSASMFAANPVQSSCALTFTQRSLFCKTHGTNCSNVLRKFRYCNISAPVASGCGSIYTASRRLDGPADAVCNLANVRQPADVLQATVTTAGDLSRFSRKRTRMATTGWGLVAGVVAVEGR